MQSNKTTASLLQPDLFPDFRTASFSPPKHSRDLCIPQRKWEFLCHTLYLGKYPFLLGPKGCGKSSVAMELADAMEMDYFGFDMGQAFKPKKMFVGGLVIGDEGKTLAVRSEFFKAFTSDRPTLIFLDELTRIPMVAANFLMTILDRRQSYLYDEDSGVRYNKGTNVQFIAAGNTGFAYVSTQRLDSAFEDRFIKVQLDYSRGGSGIDDAALSFGKSFCSGSTGRDSPFIATGRTKRGSYRVVVHPAGFGCRSLFAVGLFCPRGGRRGYSDQLCDCR